MRGFLFLVLGLGWGLAGCSGEAPSVAKRPTGAPSPVATASPTVQAYPPRDTTAFWRRVITNPAFRPEEKSDSFLVYNFGRLWANDHQNDVYGFIGDHFDRLRVVLLGAKRDPRDRARYRVRGKTRVEAATRSFTGTFRLLHVRERANPMTDLDWEDMGNVRRRGVAVALVELREDSTQTGAGVFRGRLVTWWYIDAHGRLTFDDFNEGLDDYTNNAFVGEWHSYDGQRRARAHWGDAHIPDAGPLDVGADDFYPDSAYATRGWHSYRNAIHTGDWKLDQVQW